MSRDSQKSKVYRAENAAYAQIRDAGIEVPSYQTQAEYKRRVDEIVGSQFFRDAFPRSALKEVSVTWSPRKHGAGTGIDGITTGTSMYVTSELVLIHELAHTVQKREWAWASKPGDKYASFDAAWSDPGHGRKYCEIYLRLVARFMGTQAHDMLKLQFKARGVKYTHKRKGRELTCEQRAVLVERLKVARERKGAA